MSIQYYEMSLKWISFPNLPLNVGRGGTIDNYPYIYVRFYNQGFINTLTSLISNNKNSAVALFKVPIDSYYLDIPTNFWTLKGDDRSQIVLFRPDQSIRFTLTLPDGTVIFESTQDSTSPSPLNPLVQVNASISMSPVQNYGKSSFTNLLL